MEAKENLKANKFTLLADKGYNNAREIEACQQNDLKTIVAQQELVNSNPKGTTKEYLVDKFRYNKRMILIRVLKDKHSPHLAPGISKSGMIKYRINIKSRTPECKIVRQNSCAQDDKKGGREIERSQDAESVSETIKTIPRNQDLYHKRQKLTNTYLEL
ncbi:MAG: hypothetical protein IPK08_12035 [Bacteroidetes bacterium]|nr:hypothetical protein [Bacteroidota bacterium]